MANNNISDIPIQFVGILPSISMNLDISYRSIVLNEIEKGKVALKIAYGQEYKSNSLLYIDGRNLKVLSNNSKKEMFIKIPLHHIGAISYLFEDKINILVVKYGDIDLNDRNNEISNNCFLTVLFCESKAIAERICFCVDDFFKIIYNTPKSYTYKTNSNDKLLSNQAEPLSSQTSLQYAFRSNSYSDFDVLENSSPPLSFGSISRQISVESHTIMPAAYETQIDNVAQQLINNYMEKLMNIFTKEEFDEFSQIMKSWHSSDFDFQIFCQKLSTLFGEERFYLLKDMSPFIPAKDMPSFQAFLNNIEYL